MMGTCRGRSALAPSGSGQWHCAIKLSLCQGGMVGFERAGFMRLPHPTHRLPPLFPDERTCSSQDSGAAAQTQLGRQQGMEGSRSQQLPDRGHESESEASREQECLRSKAAVLPTLFGPFLTKTCHQRSPKLPLALKGVEITDSSAAQEATISEFSWNRCATQGTGRALGLKVLAELSQVDPPLVMPQSRSAA